MELPTVVITQRLRNPEWVPEYVDGLANMDGYYGMFTVEVEILTVHFSTGTMRVRTKWMGKTETFDVSNDAFFASYAVKQV